MKKITINYVPQLGLAPVSLEVTAPGDVVGNAPHMYREAHDTTEIRVPVAWRVWKNRKTYIIPLNHLLNCELED
jgi:hypothetical protein